VLVTVPVPRDVKAAGQPGAEAAPRAVELRLRQVQGAGQVGVFQPRIPQVCAQQVNRCQISAAQVCRDEAGAPKVGAAEPERPKVQAR
jgi:hypothetical protein